MHHLMLPIQSEDYTLGVASKIAQKLVHWLSNFISSQKGMFLQFQVPKIEIMMRSRLF